MYFLFTEKKDLVELVIRQNCLENGLTPPPPPASSSSTTTASNESSNASTQPPLRRKIPEERKKSFPNSYVQSTHRHDWLEKMEAGQDDIALNIDEDDDFVVVTPVQPMESGIRLKEGFSERTKACQFHSQSSIWLIMGRSFGK